MILHDSSPFRHISESLYFAVSSYILLMLFYYCFHGIIHALACFISTQTGLTWTDILTYGHPNDILSLPLSV